MYLSAELFLPGDVKYISPLLQIFTLTQVGYIPQAEPEKPPDQNPPLLRSLSMASSCGFPLKGVEQFSCTIWYI